MTTDTDRALLDYTPGPLPEPAAIAWMYPEGRPCTLSWSGRDEERMAEMQASRGLVRVELVARVEVARHTAELRAEVAREVAAAVAKERERCKDLVRRYMPAGWSAVYDAMADGTTPKEPT